MQDFCYIQVIVFDLSLKRLLYFSRFFMVGDLLSPNRCHWQIAKVKNYNLNVTEVLHPTFKKSFPGIFNFTVWILLLTSRLYMALSPNEPDNNLSKLSKKNFHGRIQTVKLKIPGKLFLKVGCRIPVTFKLQFLTLAIYQWQL